ncbi:MAG: hypothetical protein OP8BY_0833 [Candidatus Saccharicenans subterraneus]|uniref:UPF0235 protein OP8BY_0833 n=1 Tax=Candidatus Saccharicenans subterraneus TaxID=2508984 RepID=A0A3E2BQB4_9BACT|nr:MAG: hypothetical protein OP8BY_0833 [Candidatus Saccharicenans subterraneum]
MAKTILTVRVQPKASKREIVPITATEFRVRLTSAPEKGRANRELLELLSEHLDLPLSRLKIVRGEKSRVKLVEIS